MLKQLVWIIVLLLFSVVVLAQVEDCPATVSEALEAVNVNCETLNRNHACYGHERVDAEFINGVDSHFDSPPDQVSILDMVSLTSYPLNIQQNEWGIALINLQAKIPDALPGQNVIFVLMGDTEVENAVSPENTFTPAEGISVKVSVLQGANVRTGPGIDYPVIGGILSGDELTVDAVDSSGEWLRTGFRERIAWIHSQTITTSSRLDELPTINPEQYNTMQAFYLRTGIGSPDCHEASDILLIQTPSQIPVQLTVNGANLNIGSTVVLSTPQEDLMEIAVLDGKVEILDENYQPTGLVIYSGQKSNVCLGSPANHGLDGQSNDRIIDCEFSPPETLDYNLITNTYCELQTITTLNYAVDLVCPGETPPVQTSSGSASDSAIAGVDCSTFSLIGPFSGITPRPTIFSWSAAQGASDYEIVFYDFEGNVAQTFQTQETSITLNVGQIPTGSELAWEVRAYYNGAYACVTSRTPTIFREADPLGGGSPDQPNQPASLFSARPPDVPCATGGGSICLKYSDGYTWLVASTWGVCSWSTQPFGSNTVQIANFCDGKHFAHILGTNLVRGPY